MGRFRSIVAGNDHRRTRFTIHCGWQWPSMGTLHNILWLAILVAIDGHASQSIVAGNDHGSTHFTIYCGWQEPSMDTFHYCDRQ